MSQLRSTFGQKLRAIRKSQKISQEGLATRCGLHYTYIGAVERGECNLSFDNIEKISIALDVPIGDLFFLPEAQGPLSEEDSLRAEILNSMLKKSKEDITLGIRVLKDTMEWLGKSFTKPRKRRKRRKAEIKPMEA